MLRERILFGNGKDGSKANAVCIVLSSVKFVQTKTLQKRVLVLVVTIQRHFLKKERGLVKIDGKTVAEL